MKILMVESLLWDSPYQVGSHKYARLFAEDGHQVFWLAPQWNLLGLVKHSLIKDEEAVPKSFRIWRHGGIRVHDNIVTYAPLTLLPYRNSPGLSSEMVANLSWRFTIPSLNSVLHHWGFNNVDVLWLTEPASYFSMRLVSYRFLVHRVFDDLQGHENLSKTTHQLQIRLIKDADIVLVTAKTLLQQVERIRRKAVHLVPNGVDYEHFVTPTDPPCEYEKIPPPRVVYVGAIREWFDVELLAYAARSLPQYSFVLIGDPLIDISLIRTMPNVFCLGSRDFRLIPAYLQHSQVGIIPFKVNRLTNSVHPIKLYEYFASGLPVVSVKLDEIYSIRSPAVLTSTPDEFVDALQRAAITTSSDASVRYRQFAEQHRWINRYAIVRDLLNQLDASYTTGVF